MKNITYSLILVLAIIMVNGGCTKDFLDAKPSTSIVQPTTLEEFQSLLDNYNVINVSSALGILSGDEYIYSSDPIWLSATSATQRNSYIWAKDIYEGEVSDDWNYPYSAIFYANNVLAGLDKVQLTPTNGSQLNNIRGWAYFVRAFAYYELASHFAPIYNASTATTDLGVPLRTEPSIDDLPKRSTVKETFDLILSDLAQASRLLDPSLPLANRNRPSKIAAQALFARINLSMRNYADAELHADTCLKLYSKLIDYKTLSKTATAPFSITNDELIYSKIGVSKSAYAATSRYTQLTSELIGLYPVNDLRLSIYFAKQADGTYDMKRAYHGNGSSPFIGLATDEVYLIKAECLARRGQFMESMDVLNQLLSKRWDRNATVPAKPYQDVVSSNTQEAIDKVLLERRKELVWRGLRWDDIKRLNNEGANIGLSRNLNGETYTLTPNSPRYVFPIPDDEISLSGIQQNLR